MGILDKVKQVTNSVGLVQQASNLVGNLRNSFDSSKEEEEKEEATSVTNGMYDAQLEKLINIALADGNLSEKGKQVLFRKAESLGIDIDEFELVLDAIIRERQKNAEKTEFLEPAFSKTSIHQLLKIMTDIESEMRNRKKKTKTSFSVGNSVSGAINGLFTGGVSGAVFGAIDGVSIDSDSENIEVEITERKKQAISNFPIPAIKEEILEFLSFSVPMAKKKGNFFTSDNAEYESHNEFVATWKTKCEQVITKTKLSMQNDTELVNNILMFAKELGLKN